MLTLVVPIVGFMCVVESEHEQGRTCEGMQLPRQSTYAIVDLVCLE